MNLLSIISIVIGVTASCATITTAVITILRYFRSSPVPGIPSTPHKSDETISPPVPPQRELMEDLLLKQLPTTKSNYYSSQVKEHESTLSELKKIRQNAINIRNILATCIWTISIIILFIYVFINKNRITDINKFIDKNWIFDLKGGLLIFLFVFAISLSILKKIPVAIQDKYIRNFTKYECKDIDDLNNNISSAKHDVEFAKDMASSY